MNWHWRILPDQDLVPGAPPCLQDVGSYELYASLAPGSRSWIAWWTHPSRGITLTPDDKESDPNSLALLLRAQRNGGLGLMYAYQFPRDQVTMNGQPSWKYVGNSIGNVPPASALSYSMAVMTPRTTVPVGGMGTADGKPVRRSKRRRQRR